MMIGRTGISSVAAAVTLCLALSCDEDNTMRPGSGPAAPDTISPAEVLDLIVQPVSSSSALLLWTAAGDDGREGVASGYDIRHYGYHRLTVSNWGVAVPVSQSLTPRPAGSRECLLVTGLYPNPVRYFAIRVRDEVSQWSGLSNIAEFRGVESSPHFGGDDGEILALELSGELLGPPELVEQLTTDLAVIRATYPYMRTVSARPRYNLGELLVQLTEEAWAEYERGEYEGLDELNAAYGPVEISRSLFNHLHLAFEKAYNSKLLADIYEGAEGTIVVYPANETIDGSDIHCKQAGTYKFEKAWGDCWCGCVYHHYWIFGVDGCEVELVDEYGDPLTNPEALQLMRSN